MPLDDQDIRLLAWWARKHRPHGASRWDEPGVAAAVAKVRNLDANEVAQVVIRATADRELRTPAAIGDPRSSAWRQRERIAEPTFDPKAADVCRLHHVVRDSLGQCRSCAADALAGDEPRAPGPRAELDPEHLHEVTTSIRDAIAKSRTTAPATAGAVPVPPRKENP